MKIEFLDDISDGGRFPQVVSDQLIRLYDFDSSHARKLRNTIQNLIFEDNNEIDLSTLDFIEPVNCNLTFQISDTDVGITSSDNTNFVCNLTTDMYKKIILLINPFCEKKK